MLIWDTTPIIKCADAVIAKADTIEAAINWDELLPEKKDVLTRAKIALSSAASLAKLKAENGHVGHYVDIEGIIQKLNLARDEYLIVFRQVFPGGEIQDPVLFNLLYDEEWLIMEKKRVEQMWHEKRLYFEMKDGRYKCCKNGHCYNYLRPPCPWCGEEEVVERLDINTPITTIDFFVGCRDGKWGLTTNPDIEGKSERLRKITVDMVGKHKLYYHLDGQNPNPFCNNSILLGDQRFEGRRIVQLCDELLDGNKDFILIK